MSTPEDIKPYTQGICVFCGSRAGTEPAFTTVAKEVGAYLGSKNQVLVYGGGNGGLMGSVSSAALEAGGFVHGVRPVQFDQVNTGNTEITTVTSRGVTEKTTFVQSMHHRKQVMAILAQRGFVVLPGGYGTLEEMFEMTTWTQIGVHQKPVLALNVDNFFSGLKDFIQVTHKYGFVTAGNVDLVRFIGPPTAEQLASGWNWGEEVLKELERWEKDKEYYTRDAFKINWDITKT